MTTNRHEPDVRKAMLLAAAIEVARKPGGWSKLTRQLIAIEADCSEGLVSRYLGDMPDARRAIMRAAIKAEIVEIIVQSIASHDGYAIKKYLPAKLRQRSIASLLG